MERSCRYSSRKVKIHNQYTELNWLDKQETDLQGNQNTNIIRIVNNDERREKIIGEYEDLFKNNHTIKKFDNRYPTEK